MALRIVSTVLTPSLSYDLTTLANIKDDLAIPAADTSSDATLARFITEQSALVAQYCNRVFPIETIRDTFFLDRDPYPYQVTGMLSELQLTRWPVVAVTSVVDTVALGVSNVLTEGTDFVTDLALGWLTKIDPNTGTLSAYGSNCAGTPSFDGTPPDHIVVSIPNGYLIQPRIPFLPIDAIPLKPEVKVPYGGT